MGLQDFSQGNMNKKKIAFVVAIPGTAQSFLKDHFRALTATYEVHLLANFEDNEDCRVEFETIGVICHDVPIVRAICIGKDIVALWSLFRVLKKEAFASVHSVTPKAGLLSAIAAYCAGIDVRIHIYTGQVWATRKGFMRSVLKLMDKVISRLDTNLLVDGESQRQYLIDEGVLRESNSTVLANGSICGVRLERFDVSADVRNEEREKFGFGNADVVYVFLGRLNHDKGINELYAAFNRLVSVCPNAKLLLYGSDEGNYGAKVGIFDKLKPNVNFFYPGVTQNSFKVLQAGDVFVLPTWREGFGSSVIEAQALELPVITSDAYGVLDASVANETGLRCSVGDVEGLYVCMKKYYDSPDLRKHHGRAGRKRIEEKFSNDMVTAAWVDYYRKIVS